MASRSSRSGAPLVTTAWAPRAMASLTTGGRECAVSTIDARRPRQRAQLAQQIEAVCIGQHQVEQHEIEGRACEALASFRPVPQDSASWLPLLTSSSSSSSRSVV